MSSSSSSALEMEIIFQYIDAHQSDFIKVGAILQWNDEHRAGAPEAWAPLAGGLPVTKVMSRVPGLASGVQHALHTARL